MLVLAGGSGFAQAITIGAAPALTRLYTPGDFGTLAVFSGLLGILGVVASLRYDIGIPLPATEETAANVFALSVAMNFLTTVTVGAALLLWPAEVAGLLGVPSLEPLLWLLPIGLFLAGLYQALSMWAVRTRSYRDIAVTGVTQSLSSSVVQVLSGLAGLGALGLLIGYVASQSAGITRLSRLFRRSAPHPLTAVRPALMRVVARRYRTLPLLNASAALLNRLGTYLPSVVLVSLFGPSVGGLYFLTQRVIGLPSKVAGQAVQKTYFGEFAQLIREVPERSTSLFWKVVCMQATMGLPLMAMVAIPAPWLFASVFGDEWREAGVYLQILTPMFLLEFVSAPVGATLTVVERQDLFLMREVIRALLVVGILSYAQVAVVEPVVAVSLLSFAGSLGYLLHISVSWWALRTLRPASAT